MSESTPYETPTSRAEAIETGAVRYFTSKPCRHGHVAERYTLDGYCVTCRTERQRLERTELIARRASIGGR